LINTEEKGIPLITLKEPVDSYVSDVGVYSLIQLSLVDAMIILVLLKIVKRE